MSVKVTVLDGQRVSHDGRLYEPGDELEISEEQAERLDRVRAAAKSGTKAARKSDED